MTQPVSRSKLSLTSVGSGAPPDTQISIEERSYRLNSSYRPIAANRVGTAGKIVGRLR
jgi:hypothetical protein